ncbi:uncharacterized protein LOC126295260 isoform X6 [Schistocerca gregaria]|uniref:uncharacterized protein LOC126295260 isoform X6 n=1 Tax=Schistocerca gregaria TaxID=7010 RepID=UPI00211E7591|nr:uncharacterized protein LOC126295260 isoform X6 [Schistocerca gregaria]
MSAIYSMRKQVTCPHCNVLLSGNTALAAHIAKGHLPSVPITSSTTPMAPLGCSNDSDGLKTHISTAFGGLLDRGLVNRLERGRGSCGSPRLGRPPTNRPQEQTALRPAPTSASAPPAARRPRPVYDTELAKQVMRELSSKRVGTTEGTARKSHLHHYACFYCHRWFKLQSTRKLHMVSAHLNVIMASKSKQAEPGHNPDRLSGSEDSDRECGTGSGELRGVPAHSRVEHGQLDFPRQGSWSGGVVSAIPTVTPDEEEATKRKALAALREMSARRRRGRGRGTARRGTRLPPAPSSRADRLAELEERSAFDLPPVETGQLRSPKREMEYVFVEEETPFLHKWEMPDGPDTAQDPLSIEQKIGALTDDPPMEGDPLSVCDPQIVKKEVLDDPLEVSGCNVCIKEDPDFNLEVDATDNKEAATEGPFSDITDTAILTPTGHLVFEAARTGQTVPDSSHPGGGHCEDSTASDTASSTGDTAALASADNGGIAESSDFNRVGEERRLDGTGDTTQPTCYVEIIAKAILRSPERRATLSEIYAFVTNHFPYFVCSKKGWHNAIASNLWFSKYFMKVAPVGSNGKYSNYWMLDPRYEDTFKNGNFCNHCRMLLSSYGGPGAKTALAELDGPAVVTCQPPDARLYRQRHGDLSARSQLPAVGEGWTLGPLALRAATVTTGGDDPVPPSHNLQCPSTAAPSSAGVSVSEVSGSAPDSPQRSSGHCVDDRPASDTVTLTGEPVTLTSPSGGIGSSGTATDSGATASDVAASGLDGEQHSTCAADTKPPFSYMELSAMAIVHSPHRRATLSEIYAYITSRFPYFKHNKKGWRNTIRGTLSLYECFVKVPRESGVGSSYYWTLDPQYEDMFENGKFRRRQRANWPFGSCPSAAVEVADHVRHRNRTNQPRQQQQHSGLSEHCQLPSTATGPRHGSQVLHTADATDTGDGGGGGGGGGGDHLSGTTDSHCASSAPLTTPSLSVSNVDGTGKDAANSLHTDSGHIEGYALALDETVSAGTAATSTSGTDGPTNSDGASTVINSGGTTASSAASGVGEEQHTGDTESASSVDKKPPFSYKALIAMAIAQSPHRKAKLSEIYAYITRRFPYFEHNKKVWQNSIRHNLSLHKCFVKVLQKGRKEKGNYWVLDPQFEGAFKDAKYCQRQCNNQPFHRDAGAVTNSAVPGGVSAADMHFARDEHRSTEIPSFEESYLQNVSSGELVRNEEKSIHFISCSAPTRGIGLQLDNSFCSTAYMSMVDNIFSVFTCSSCLERFSSKYSLIMHVFVHIDCVQPPLHVCRYCGEVFLTYFGLNKHLWTEDDDGTLIALPFSDARGICHSSDLCSDVVSSEDHVPVSFDSVTGNSSNEQVTNTDLMKRADCTRRKDDRSSCIQAQQKDCYT